MRRGSGDVYYNGSVAINYGKCWQCSNCNQVIITKGDPVCGENIGKYASRACSYTISMYGADMEVRSIGTCNSRHLDGYYFRY